MRKILILATSTLALLACGDDKESTAPKTSTCVMPSSCAPTNGSQIEVVCPEADAEYAPGDTIHLMWRANVLDFTGFVPGVSMDGGQTWKTLTNGSVEADDAGPDNQCFDVAIVVPEDGSWTPDGTDLDNVILRVKDYSSTNAAMRDLSDNITILAE